MSKSVDVDLRIRAKNLAGKTLDELNDQVEKLSKSQKDQASSADLASRSMSDLNSEAKQLAGAYRELSRREGLTKAFADQRKEIGATANRLRELSATYQEMRKGSGGTLIGFSDKDVKRVGQEIVRTQKDLSRLVAANDKAGASLRALGVNIDAVDSGLGEVGESVRRAEAAYRGSLDSVNKHADAQRKAAEAAKEAEVRERRLQDTLSRQRRSVVEAVGRRNEAQLLQLDIKQRDRQARAAEIQAEAQRRLAADTAAATAQQERATKAIAEYVGRANNKAVVQARMAAAGRAYADVEARANASGERRRNLLIAANRAEAESAARKERLAAVLRRLNPELERNANATRRAGTNLAFFNDVGRKSLGTYQRLRGQVLGLAAAYIGIYQAINTFNKAIDVTNKRNSLMVGLRTINNGDAKAAADDLAFLTKEADRLGLVLDDLAPNFSNIAIAGKSLGLNTTQVRDVFSDTATAAAAMNLSVEDTEGVFRAMTQIFSKAKVQAEELRGQLGDRLPGAVVKFAEANNIALSDLDKQLKDGSVGIDFLIKGIESYARMYDKEIENISTRLQAYINRATNAYNDFLRSLLTGSNDQRLKDAFDRITKFFRSREGEKFAEAVSKAFGAAIDVFIAFADNIDFVVAALKIFIGIQVLKFLNDLVIGVVGAGREVRNFTKWVKGLHTAQATAAASSTTLAAKTRLLGLAFGPVGAAIVAVSGVLYTYISNIDKATERTERYTDALYDLTFAKSESDLELAKDRGAQQRQELIADIEKLEKITSAGFGIGDQIEAAKASFDLFRKNGETFRTRADAEEALANRRRELENVTQGMVSAELRLGEVIDERMKREAEDRKNPLPASPGGDDKDKGKPDNALREAEKREAVERAIQKQLLDLDQELYDARTEGQARTQADINKNYELAVQKIESETRERLLAIDALESRVRLANKGNVPESEQKSLDIARERVMELQTALNVRAFEKGEIDAIQLKEKAINDLIAERNAKIEFYNTLQETGALSAADAYAMTIKAQDDYNARISTLIDDLLPILQAIDPEDSLYEKLGIPQLIVGLQTAKAEMVKLTDAQRVGLGIASQFAGGAADALVTFGRAIVGIEGGFKAAMDAFRNFAADFLQQIAQMILQAIILQALQNAITPGGSGGYWQAVVKAFSQHTGGLAGSPGLKTREVNPMVFANAGYFHQGGLPGLKRDEVATILQKNEEVLPTDDPRHVFNGGMSAGGGEGVTQIIATFDPADAVLAGLSDTRVVKRMFAIFGKNKNQLKQNIGR